MERLWGDHGVRLSSWHLRGPAFPCHCRPPSPPQPLLLSPVEGPVTTHVFCP